MQEKDPFQDVINAGKGKLAVENKFDIKDFAPYDRDKK